MKPFKLVLLGVFVLMACARPSKKEKINNLNGYWEIKRAELSDGTIKEFPFSTVVDFIQVENQEGFRKKMRPQLDGSYLTSEDEEKLVVKVENDSINLYYSTPYNSWKETLLTSSGEEIEILNEQGIKYTYRRFTPYFTDDGQEKE